MSEEEKKLEKVIYNNKYLFCDKKDVDFLLNLIENQQKEIEELKYKLNLYDIKNMYPFDMRKYVEKLKIKNLIDENLEKESGEYIVDSNACQCLVRHLIKLVEEGKVNE